MAAVRRIGPAERCDRLGARHHLAPDNRARSVEELAGSLVALHATDPATVYLSAAARLAPGDHAVPHAVADLDRALYRDRTLVRMHGMRQTVFVLPADLAPAVEDSTTRSLAERHRARLLTFLRDSAGHDAAWLAETEAAVLDRLRTGGEAGGAELGEAVPRLREQVVVAPGKPYEAKQGIGSRILRQLGLEGRIVRGRPVGGWTSGQFRWAAAGDGTGPRPGDPSAARSEIVRRWLASFGPGTEADLKWWTGWPLGRVRDALRTVHAQPVELEEGPGWVLPGDADPAEPSGGGDHAPWAALLPALDATAMGWQQRGFYLPEEHRAALFDRSGNIGPTIWWNGRIVGGWAQRADGSVARRLLEDHGTEAATAVAEAAERLTSWLGGTRVTPRFRTPLERELS